MAINNIDFETGEFFDYIESETELTVTEEKTSVRKRTKHFNRSCDYSRFFVTVFIHVLFELTKEKCLTRADFSIIIYICRYMDHNNRLIVNYDLIAKELHESIRTVKDSIKKLVEKKIFLQAKGTPVLMLNPHLAIGTKISSVTYDSFDQIELINKKNTFQISEGFLNQRKIISSE